MDKDNFKFINPYSCNNCDHAIAVGKNDPLYCWKHKMILPDFAFDICCKDHKRITDKSCK